MADEMIIYTVKTHSNGTKEWYLGDKRHRPDGPAVEYADGTKFWFLDDKMHREDGPAIECADGSKEWWINGKLHRVDGPAIERADGDKWWYINGEVLTKKEFDIKSASYPPKVVTIDGVQFKLVRIVS